MVGRDADLEPLGRLHTLRPILWALLAAFAGWVALVRTKGEMIPMFGLGFPETLLPVVLWVFAAALCFAGFFKSSPKLWFVRTPLLIGFLSTCISPSLCSFATRPSPGRHSCSTTNPTIALRFQTNARLDLIPERVWGVVLQLFQLDKEGGCAALGHACQALLAIPLGLRIATQWKMRQRRC